MASWLLKAAIQKAISLLPEGHKINYVFQKHVTKMRLDDAVMDQALVHCADHVRHFKAHRRDETGFATLELGTGWYTVVPIGLFLCGAESIRTVDLTPLLRADNLLITIRKFCEYHERGRLAKFLPNLKAERLQALISLGERAGALSVDATLNALGIRYLVMDARRLALPDACLDLIHSNDVFEHIYPNVLQEILREFKRVAKADGLMSHFIDMSDHFAHFDSSIDDYHFLRYSDAQWKVIDNGIAPQSRLRLTEYRVLYERAAIGITEEKVLPSNPADVSRARLASRFKRMPQAEVAVKHAYLVSSFS